MKRFLENICDEIIKENKNIISDICVVFPSKRAGIFFRSILGKKLNQPTWAPTICSIENFIEELSGCVFTEKLELLFELYSVYLRVMQEEKTILEEETGYINLSEEENFESFYPWGEMLLNDFDTIDKYLVNTSFLFKRIIDLKEIDELFPIELQEEFRKFWGTLFDKKPTNAKNNFLNIWQILGRLYDEYKESLIGKDMCYEGMAYKKINDSLDDVLKNLKWKKIIFAGFNSLNPVEKNMFKFFIDKGIGKIYWDGDDYYVLDKNQEAGYFIRNNLKHFETENLKFNSELLAGAKNINIIGTPSREGMAKVLGSELKERVINGDVIKENTVVVLPDDNLLLPVLHSIPDEIKDINVTMGFQFKDTSLYDLINLLIDLQNDTIFENGQNKFHHSIVRKILLHPYIKFQNLPVMYEIVNIIRDNNIIYFGLDDYDKSKPEILEFIFRKVENADNAVRYIENILNLISNRIEKDESKNSDYKKFQLEYLFTFYSNFNKLNETLKEPSANIKLETYWRLIRNVLGKICIPFTGETLKGLQIMGMLETRALDFENVFILSVNEGVLPAGRLQKSFIPYALRKVMRMPTYEDDDSIAAYYFYRLLQKAKNIYLIYNTDVGDDSKEKSRYILQVENELVTSNKKINCSGKIVIPDVYNIETGDIQIIKNELVIEKLKKMERYSPTMLVEYISCPLLFYFDKIAGLKQEKDVEETFTPAVIGSVLHKILENIYKPFEGTEVTEKNLEDIIENAEKNFDETLEKAVKECKMEFILYNYGGKNNLFKNIMRSLVNRVIENDKNELPFRIVKVEEALKDEFKINVKGKELTLNIFGRLDRIDEKNGITRIIDYKTSGFEFKPYNQNNPFDYFENLITKPDFKENFQAFFYGYLYSKLNPERKINVGLYPVKKLQGGIKKLKEDFIYPDEFKLFEEKLKSLLTEIHNPDIPFIQTLEEKRCAYCIFDKTCYRDLKNTI